MIYFDNSATTFPKPAAVISAVSDTMRNYSANPGRSGYSLSLKAAGAVFDTRQTAAKLFNVDDERKIIFTSGCTSSLNIVIKGVLKPGDHCIISCLDHNSVLRPVEKLKSIGVTYSVAQVYPADNDKTVDSFRSCINNNTKLIVCTHASNVFGLRLPVERICALAHQYGVLFCLDAAQSAGVLDIDVQQSGFDYVCCAGHKGLYGPMGVGLLIINSDTLPDSLIEGGTGSESANYAQPDFLPDRYESGTLNVCGISGLNKGMQLVLKNSPRKIAEAEIKLIQRLYKALSAMDHVKLYTDYPTLELCAPVLSFSIDNMNSEDVSAALNNRFDIATRAGLHCAPLAHKFMKTIDEGTVRVSPSMFSTDAQVTKLIFAIKYLAQNTNYKLK